MSSATSVTLWALLAALSIAGPADVAPNLNDRPLYTFNESDLDRYLQSLPETTPDLPGRA